MIEYFDIWPRWKISVGKHCCAEIRAAVPEFEANVA